MSDRTSLLCLFAVLYSFRVTRSAGPFWKERKIALVLGGTAGDAKGQRLLESARYGSRNGESCITVAGVHSSSGDTAKESSEQARSSQR